MAIEFQITLENKPGSLAKLTRLLGHAGVNIDAIQGRSGRAESVVHLVADSAEHATAVLRGDGVDFTTREVLLVKVLDEPGVLGDVALVMSDAGVNIDSIYATTKGLLVLGVDDYEGAVQVAGGMAVMQSSY
jgi:hypothetical protein